MYGKSNSLLPKDPRIFGFTTCSSIFIYQNPLTSHFKGKVIDQSKGYYSHFVSHYDSSKYQKYCKTCIVAMLPCFVLCPITGTYVLACPSRKI